MGQTTEDCGSDGRRVSISWTILFMTCLISAISFPRLLTCRHKHTHIHTHSCSGFTLAVGCGFKRAIFLTSSK